MKSLLLCVSARIAVLARNQRGQDLIEYALLGGIVAASILGLAILFDGAVASLIDGVGNCIDFAASPCGGEVF